MMAELELKVIFLLYKTFVILNLNWQFLWNKKEDNHSRQIIQKNKKKSKTTTLKMCISVFWLYNTNPYILRQYSYTFSEKKTRV